MPRQRNGDARLARGDANCTNPCRWRRMHANDEKQQNILGGDISNSGIVPCTSCICERSHFGVWTERLWSLKRIRGVCGPAYERPRKRVKYMSYEACAVRFSEKTNGGTQILTANQKRAQTIECANVFRPPLLKTHPKKLTNDPLHISSGTANKALDCMRDVIRAFDTEYELFSNAMQAKNVCEILLRQHSLSNESSNRSNESEELEPLLLPVHRESLAL